MITLTINATTAARATTTAIARRAFVVVSATQAPADRHDDEEELARDAQRLVGDPHHRGHDHADDQQDGDDRRQPLSAGGLGQRCSSRRARYDVETCDNGRLATDPTLQRPLSARPHHVGVVALP